MTQELVRRIAFTIGALLLYRLGTYIPLAGINPDVWEQLFRTQQGGILGMFNMFAGGGIHRMAILALGLTPYWTAAVIMQLLSVVWRGLKSLERSGDAGRRKIARYTLVLTLLMTGPQGYGVAVGLKDAHVVDNPDGWFLLSATTSLVGGTFFLIWLSEKITRHGIGNGLALIFLAGLVAELPSVLANMLEHGRTGAMSIGMIRFVVVMAVVVIAFVVFMEGARRNVRIEFAKRMIGKRLLPARSAVLPIKINSAGFLMPTTMLAWIYALPYLAAVIFGGSPLQLPAAGAVVFGAIALIVLAFIYTALVIDPEHAAETLHKHGGVIPGVEPGESTAKHLDRVVSLTTVIGAVYLIAMWLMPEALMALFGVPYFSGGTALILVCTVLDIRTQVRDLSRTNLMGAEQR